MDELEKETSLNFPLVLLILINVSHTLLVQLLVWALVAVLATLYSSR